MILRVDDIVQCGIDEHALRSPQARAPVAPCSMLGLRPRPTCHVRADACIFPVCFLCRQRLGSVSRRAAHGDGCVAVELSRADGRNDSIVSKGKELRRRGETERRLAVVEGWKVTAYARGRQAPIFSAGPSHSPACSQPAVTNQGLLASDMDKAPQRARRPHVVCVARRAVLVQGNQT